MMKTSKLFMTLPEAYECTPDGMEIDRYGNLILSCPNYADEHMSGCVLRITKDRRVEKWFDVPVHPETGVARNMGIAFDGNWNIYLCDNQGWSERPELLYKGRVLKCVVDDAGNGARGNARSGCNVVNCHKSCPVCCKGLQTSLRLEMQRKSWNAGWEVCFARVLWSKHTAGWTSCSGNSCDLYPLYHIGVDSTRELFRIFEFFAIDFIKRFQTFLKSWRKFARRIGKTA